MNAPAALSDAKRRVLDALKRVDAATPGELAEQLDLTEAAIRQHLDALAKLGLVQGRERAAVGRGRPPIEWALTEIAVELFPDRHADLTVELIDAIRSAVGESGLDRVIAERTARQSEVYRGAIPSGASLRKRVDALARIRDAEGYMAEVDRDGSSLLLVEKHCPVCAAASACQGLCRGELELFRDVLGPDAVVERTQHLLSGDKRCAYRISVAK